MMYNKLLLFYDPLSGVNVTNRSCWHDFVKGNLLVLPEDGFPERNKENEVVTEPIKIEPLEF